MSEIIIVFVLNFQTRYTSCAQCFMIFEI